ncbi:MAG: hypothetical protein JNL90_00270 [Planctomycetes bacterium]|nr:hypothetical protein [Planctomycetota bacterium]
MASLGDPKQGLHTPWWAALTLIGGVGLLVHHVCKECSYYMAPLGAQALDPRHAALRSSGRVGLALGVVAAALMVLNLAYLVRRRWVGASWLGSLRGWMDLHVVSGLLAGGCVLLHAAGHLRSASATVASVALAIVLFTGVIGRYVLAQLPRTREGRELSLDEANARFAELRAQLSEFGLPPLELPPSESLRAISRGRALLGVLFGDPVARAAHERYRALLRDRTPEAAIRRRIEPLLDSILREAQRLARLRDLSALMASWRFLHRWLALVMVGTAICHIALAVRWGSLDWHALDPRNFLP